MTDYTKNAVVHEDDDLYRDDPSSVHSWHDGLTEEAVRQCSDVELLRKWSSVCLFYPAEPENCVSCAAHVKVTEPEDLLGNSRPTPQPGGVLRDYSSPYWTPTNWNSISSYFWDSDSGSANLTIPAYDQITLSLPPGHVLADPRKVERMAEELARARRIDLREYVEGLERLCEALSTRWPEVRV
jgi:hypothetical protein